uniref:FBD domain-containing protein n=1 Tax=Arundo donax TaxID=35708 RepID=A0A0A9GQZ5_ARUDO
MVFFYGGTMSYRTRKDGYYYWPGKVAWAEVSSCMRCGLDHLKMVYMSGFRCYRAQMELLCSILANGAALEHVTIQPMVTINDSILMNLGKPDRTICDWAHRASKRFGKEITVVSSHQRLCL